MSVRILVGDCRERLKELPDASVHCCVTSPPYFGLRDYGVDGQMGLEPTPDEFVAGLIEVFREVRRVLRDDGTLWLNIGDSYARLGGDQVAQTKWKVEGASDGQGTNRHLITGSSDGAVGRGDRPGSRSAGNGLKQKDLIGIPWMLAFALRADGWFLRQDLIWSKPNPMPESVRDRCTKAHEYLFLLAKSERYFYDATAIAEAAVTDDTRRPYGSEGSWQLDGRPVEQRPQGKQRRPAGWMVGPGSHGSVHADGRAQQVEYVHTPGETRNRRSVWHVPTQSFPEAHFATFPPQLIEPCILAGCPKGGTVLDPFFGAGTTGLVADRLGRNAIGIELNPAYAEMAMRRIQGDSTLFADVSIETTGPGTRAAA